jgi:hypothetical protein
MLTNEVVLLYLRSKSCSISFLTAERRPLQTLLEREVLDEGNADPPETKLGNFLLFALIQHFFKF